MRYAKINSDYTQSVETQITYSALAADNSFNDSADGFITAGFKVGDSITVSGWMGGNQQEYWKNNLTTTVLSLTASKMVVDATLTDAPEGDSITITAQKVLVPGSETVVEVRDMAGNFNPADVSHKFDFRVVNVQADPVFDPATHRLIGGNNVANWDFVINPADVEATRKIVALTQEEIDTNTDNATNQAERDTAATFYAALKAGTATNSQVQQVVARLLKDAYL